MYKYKAKLIKIIDGDTLDVLVDLGFGIFHKIRLRLIGINTPEIFGRHVKEEKPLGLKFKHKLEEILSSEDEFIVRTYKDKKGKYGRYLAEIQLKNGSEVTKLLKEYADELGVDISY